MTDGHIVLFSVLFLFKLTIKLYACIDNPDLGLIKNRECTQNMIIEYWGLLMHIVYGDSHVKLYMLYFVHLISNQNHRQLKQVCCHSIAALLKVFSVHIVYSFVLLIIWQCNLVIHINTYLIYNMQHPL